MLNFEGEMLHKIFSFILGLGLAIIPAALVAQETTVLSAISPNGRSAQVGETVTVFGGFLNTGDEFAQNCVISPPGNFSGEFLIDATNAQTNEVFFPGSGFHWSPGPGQYVTYLLSITPNAVHDSVEIEPIFKCDNTDAAPVFPGVNTFIFSASADPTPDILAVSGTIQNNGISNIPGGTGIGMFVVSSTNLGSTGDITITGEAIGTAGGAGLPALVDVKVCETDPLTSICLAPASASVTVNFAQDEIRSFGFFAEANDKFAFDPGNARIFALFTDAGGVVRGSTSIAPRIAEVEIDDNLTIRPDMLFYDEGGPQQVSMRTELGGDWLSLPLATKLEVHQVDPDTGNKIALLGELFDDGDPAHNDDQARDGIFNNFFDIDPGAVDDDRYYMVEAPLFGTQSDYFLLSITDSLTLEEYQAIQIFTGEVNDSLRAAIAGGTTVENAVDDAIAALLGNSAIISAAGPLERDEGVWFITAEDTLGTIDLDISADGTSSTRGSSTQIPAALSPFPQSKRVLSASAPSKTVQSYSRPQAAGDFSNVVDSNKALILSPYEHSFGDEDEGQEIADQLEVFGMEVTYKENAAVTLSDFKNMDQYGVIVIVTHGTYASQGYPDGLGKEARKQFVKRWRKVVRNSARKLPGQTIGQLIDIYGAMLDVHIDSGVSSNTPTAQQLKDIKALRLGTKINNNFSMTGLYFDYYSGRFPNSLIVIGACNSAAGPSVANAFVNNIVPKSSTSGGAGAYMGWNYSVDVEFAYKVSLDTFNDLVDNSAEAGRTSRIGAIDNVFAFAEFKFFGASDLQLDPFLKNGGFEHGKSAWDMDGAAKASLVFGSTSARTERKMLSLTTLGNGTGMVNITNGGAMLNGPHTLKSSAKQSFLLPEDVLHIEYEVRVLTEEAVKPADSSIRSTDYLILSVVPAKAATSTASPFIGGRMAGRAAEDGTASLFPPAKDSSTVLSGKTVFQFDWKKNHINP
jgi:hypothetical protein